MLENQSGYIFTGKSTGGIAVVVHESGYDIPG
jgi:hypothetical protein